MKLNHAEIDQQGDSRKRATSLSRVGLRIGIAVGGPLLIVVAVLAILHNLAFGSNLSNQHPDLLPVWLPTFCFLGKSLAAGHIPAFNPYVTGGAPFVADPQSGWLYLPPMILFTTLSCATALRWMVVLQPLIAGLGLYWFLRGINLSRAAATAGGLAISAGVAACDLVLFLPFPSSIAWTTVLLGTSSRFLSAASSRRRVLWAIATALAWGQLMSAHAEQGLILGSGAMAAYIAVAATKQVREHRWSLHDCLTRLGFLAVSLPAVNTAIILPRLAYLSHSSYKVGLGALRQVWGLELPWTLQFATSPGVHLGAAILGLSFAAFWSPRHRLLAASMATYGGLCFLLSLRVVARPLSRVLENVPVLGLYSHFPRRFGFGLLIAVPILGALGVDAFLTADSTRKRLLMAAPGVVTWFALPPAFGAPARNLALVLVAGAATAVLLAASKWKGALALGVPAVLAMELVTNGAVGHVWAAPARSPPFRTYGWFNPLAKPNVDSKAYLAPTSIALAIRREGGRYLSVGAVRKQQSKFWGALGNQRSMLFEIESVQGYDIPFHLERYWVFARALSGGLAYNVGSVPPSRPAVELLSVSAVVAQVDSPPAALASPEATARDGSWALYPVLDPTPRASLITGWDVVARPSEALAEAIDPLFDSRSTAVVEAEPGRTPPRPEGPGSRPGTADLAWLDAQSARIQVDAPREALVVIRNVWDPNWHATMDGHPVKLFPTDYLLEGLFVPPGRHTILLRYNDLSIGRGFIASLVALVVLAAAAWFSGRKSSPPTLGVSVVG